ncbi:PAS domain S-box protein [Deinococcus peraridilitoris]|uniref:PAS domain S-box n=1 Tax=Deinococcus peraridilitoris (strain DSM 19664 / LMG 22246 / CIP 109416 / KR-200) TaxID=937777 RepID=L0A2S8_DEIPD|nr:PAS domain S-box protein [Deinococcus peraridilitoris]AFZ67749.1 PAS domain S-box [Deinococcus peraridilitoris DSM 19664]
MTEASPSDPQPPRQVPEQQISHALMQAARALVVLTDAAGHIVRFNQACVRFTGIAEAHAVGRYVWELLPPESIPSAQAFFQGVAEERLPRESELVLTRHDGQKRTIAWSNTPLLDEQQHWQFVLSVGVDVTVERILTSDLQENTSQLEQLRDHHALIELSQDAITALEPDGTVRHWNPAAARLYGWTSEEARGLNLYDLLHTVFPVSRQDMLHTVRRHGHWEGELLHTTRAGAKVTTLSRLVLHVDNAGKPTSLLEVGSDVTSLKQAEQERERLLEQLSMERRHFEAVLQQLPVGIMLVDLSSRRISFTNARFEQLIGQEVQPGAPITPVLQRLLHGNDRPLKASSPLVQALQGAPGAANQDLFVQHPDGRRLHVWASAAPIHNRLDVPVAAVFTLDHADDRWQQALSSNAQDGLPAEDSVTPQVFVRKLGRSLAALGSSPLEGRLVALLLLSTAPMSMSQAAQALSVTKGALSKVVHEMQQRGDLLVTRHFSTREHSLALAHQMYLRDLMERRDLSAGVASLAYAFLRDNPDLDPEVAVRVRDLADIRAQHALNIAKLLQVRQDAQRREREQHLRDNWDAVPPKSGDHTKST